MARSSSLPALLVAVLLLPALAAGALAPRAALDPAAPSEPSAAPPSSRSTVFLASATPAATAHAHIEGFVFDPDPIEIAVGDSVTWHNHDGATHTATDDGSAWTTGFLGFEESETLTFHAAATYTYHCAVHPSMTGTLVVGGAPNDPPTVAITSPANGATVGGLVSVTGTAADADGSVAEVQVRIDGGAWELAMGTTSWSFSWNTAPLPNGAHTIEARSYDGAAHSALASVSVTVSNPANIPPTATIVTPANGATVAATDLVFDGTAADADGAVVRVDVRVDGGPWIPASGTGAWTFAYNARMRVTGPMTIEARAFDGAIYGAASSVSVTVQNQLPVATLTSPAPGATVTGTIQLTGTAADPEGHLMRVEYRVDAGPWVPVAAAASWSASWDTSTVPDGLHTLTVRAVDPAQPGTPTAPITVNVTNPRPDLVVSALVIEPMTPDPSKTRVRATIANVGTGAAGQFFVHTLIRGTGDNRERLVGLTLLPSLAAGSSIEVAAIIIETGRVGAFTVLARADAGNLVGELNEANNDRSGQACLPSTLGAASCLVPGRSFA